MMQREHPGEATTGTPGAFLDEAIRVLTQIAALHRMMTTTPSCSCLKPGINVAGLGWTTH